MLHIVDAVLRSSEKHESRFKDVHSNSDLDNLTSRDAVRASIYLEQSTVDDLQPTRVDLHKIGSNGHKYNLMGAFKYRGTEAILHVGFDNPEEIFDMSRGSLIQKIGTNPTLRISQKGTQQYHIHIHVLKGVLE